MMLLPTTRSVGCVVAVCGLALTQASLANPGIELIYSKIDGHPSSVVPGVVDAAGNPVETHWRSMLDFSLSPDGTNWVLRGAAQLNGGTNVMVKGEGMTGSVFAQADRPMPGAEPGTLYDFFQGIPRFNNLNHMAYRARAKGANTLQHALVWTPAGQTVAFRQGDFIQGLLTLNGAPGSGFFGNSFNSLHIDDNGRVGSQDGTITGISTLWRPAIMYNDVAFQQNRNPANEIIGLDGTTILHWGPNWSNIGGGPASESFMSSMDGTQWIARGGINDQPPEWHQALVVNGKIRAQQGFAIPGTSIIVNTIIANDMAANGDWVARGTIAGGGVWAMHNGIVVAATGQPITPGSTELWGDSFLSIHCNAMGDWVLVGTTDFPDPAVDTVVVLNGDRVLLREGEEIDITGPGITNGVFIGRGNSALSAFGANMTLIGNNRMVYLTANLRDGLGNEYNLAGFSTPMSLLRIDASEGGPCYANCDNSTTEPILNVDDFTCFINEFAGAQSLPHEQQINHYANCDGSTTAPVLNVDDFTCFINAFAAGCP